MQKARMSLSKCINAAEMGLTIRQASTLLDIPYRQVLALSREYGIKFVCGKRKANEQRRKARLAESDTSVVINDSKSRFKEQIQSEARAGGDKSARRTLEQIIDDIYTSKIPINEKYERIYGVKLWHFENDMINLGKRPPFPKEKKHTPETAENRLIRQQRETSVQRRRMIMSCFDGSVTRVAEDVNRMTKIGLRSCSQMLDIMYRDGDLNRERVQVGRNRRNSVYHYSRK